MAEGGISQEIIDKYYVLVKAAEPGKLPAQSILSVKAEEVIPTFLENWKTDESLHDIPGVADVKATGGPLLERALKTAFKPLGEAIQKKETATDPGGAEERKAAALRLAEEKKAAAAAKKLADAAAKAMELKPSEKGLVVAKWKEVYAKDNPLALLKDPAQYDKGVFPLSVTAEKIQLFYDSVLEKGAITVENTKFKQWMNTYIDKKYEGTEIQKELVTGQKSVSVYEIKKDEDISGIVKASFHGNTVLYTKEQVEEIWKLVIDPTNIDTYFKAIVDTLQNHYSSILDEYIKSQKLLKKDGPEEEFRSNEIFFPQFISGIDLNKTATENVEKFIVKFEKYLKSKVKGSDNPEFADGYYSKNNVVKVYLLNKVIQDPKNNKKIQQIKEQYAKEIEGSTNSGDSGGSSGDVSAILAKAEEYRQQDKAVTQSILAKLDELLAKLPKPQGGGSRRHRLTIRKRNRRQKPTRKRNL